jgi:arylsulfatase A-like enzyme
MKRILLTIALAATCLVHGSDSKPNVILILSDDQGFNDYGFMGHPVVQTPSLDRLASQSLLYTRGYVMPVCSPSLASLLTGQLPHVHGITGNDLSPAAIAAEHAKGKADRSPLAHRLLSNSVILPKVLSNAGYLTYQTGKLWNVTAEEVGFTAGMTNKEGRHGGDGLDIGRKTMQPMFDFITKAQAEQKPFFVWYAPMLPHQPHNPPQSYLAHYQGKGLSADAEKYYAMVEWFDHTCGELDDFLKQQGLSDNTVIIYLADNGWDAEQGNRAKLSPYELGIRTPMFVRWPAKVKPQRDDTTLASILDFVPTVLQACGLPVPADLPGINLLDRSRMAARQTVYVEAYTHDIANLDHPEKSLVTSVVIDGWSKLLVPGPVRPDKAYTSAATEIELYDLKADPLERKNLAAVRPDEVKRLTALQTAEWAPVK